MDNHQLWKVAEEALSALTDRYEPSAEICCAEHGLNRREWGLLLAVYTFEPEEATPAHLMVRGPYTSADTYLQRLRGLAEKKLLEEIDSGRFRMTDESRKTMLKIAEDIREVMAHFDPLPPSDSGRLAILLDRIVQASMSTPPPPDTWSISLSYKLLPALNPPMPFTEQALSCLSAYRDDAHLAAWQRSGLSAMALESLTMLWRGEITTLDDLCKKLTHRGHPCQVYVTVLGELRERGLITGPDQSPWLTGTGRVFRNEIEEDTDRFFYTPWSSLEKAEKNELYGLLTRMRDGLS
jgi:hypothetical protein